jgi:hypothetical protein
MFTPPDLIVWSKSTRHKVVGKRSEYYDPEIVTNFSYELELHNEENLLNVEGMHDYLKTYNRETETEINRQILESVSSKRVKDIGLTRRLLNYDDRDYCFKENPPIYSFDTLNLVFYLLFLDFNLLLDLIINNHRFYNKTGYEEIYYLNKFFLNNYSNSKYIADSESSLDSLSDGTKKFIISKINEIVDRQYFNHLMENFMMQHEELTDLELKRHIYLIFERRVSLKS